MKNILSERKLFLVIHLCFMLNIGLSQSIATEFGKNRVQHHDDFNNWWSYETENFVSYWYGKGKKIAHSVVQMAELDHAEIQNIIEHRINDKIEIIVYLDISDLKQSNLGSQEIWVSETGKTKVIGPKMFVYYDGNHKNLRRQIREGITNVYLNSMFQKGGLQQIVAEQEPLDLPLWYSEGSIAYFGSYWNHLIDDELRDLWKRKGEKYRNFDKLSDYSPRVAGHSFWHFLDVKYGKASLSNVFYLTRIDDLDNGFLFVFGKKIDQLKEEWRDYYQDYFSNEKNKFEKKVTKENLSLDRDEYYPIAGFRFSPDASKLLYSTNKYGKTEVKIHDLKSGKERRIFKNGYVNKIQEIDYNYPLFTWHSTGQELSILYEKRDVLYLRKIKVQSGEYIEQRLPENFQRVYSLSSIEGDEYLLSASTDGYSDLYIYNARNRSIQRLTEDFYDDLDADIMEWNGQRGIVFCSNRTEDYLIKEELDTILPIDHFDVFFMPLEAEVEDLIRLTNTLYENERQPRAIGGDQLCYLSEKRGVVNRHILDLATKQSHPVSNRAYNLINHDASSDGEMHISSFYHNGKYKVRLDQNDWKQPLNVSSTGYFELKNELLEKTKLDKSLVAIPVEKKLKKEPKIESGYLFQSEYEDPELIEPIEEEELMDQLFVDIIDHGSSEEGGVVKFVSARAVAARSSFKLEDVVTKMDNEVLFEGLQSYTGENRENLTSPVGLLLKASVTDLFEDYKIEAGIRIPIQFNGHEIFGVFDNNKKRIDHRFAFYRRTLTDSDDLSFFPVIKTKNNTLLGLYRAKYPFDVYTSIRATTSLRFDKQFLLHSNELSTNTPTVNEQRISLKLEYVFDNTSDLSYNIKNGTRYKFYAEAINKFNFSFSSDFDASRSFTTVLGVDARHYVPVLKHSVLALRGAAATSLGSERILYNLGGIENWILAKYDESTPVGEGNFGFQTLVANLRGFDQNVRNGTSFAILNSELRIPFIRYIFPSKRSTSFLSNIQLVAFFDAGTAWYGLTPNSEANPINSAVIENPPAIEVRVRYFKDPLVMGYGAGLRVPLFGYYLRFDYAWGVESRQVQDPKMYFALGVDF